MVPLVKSQFAFMDVTVIIPTRNREKALKICLNSFTKQTIFPKEIIVVDNSSTDNTREVISSFEEKLPVRYIFEGKIGPSFARNRGIQEARGDLLAFTDSDCLPGKRWVEEIINAHKKKKGVVFQGKTVYYPQNSHFFSVLYYFCLERHLRVELYSSIRNSKKQTRIAPIQFIDTNNVSFPKFLFRTKRDWFDESLSIYGEDTDLGLRFLKKGIPIFFNPSIIVRHPVERGFSNFWKNRFQAGFTAGLLKRKWDSLKEKWQLPASWERERKKFIQETEKEILKEVLSEKKLGASRTIFAAGVMAEKLFWSLGFLISSFERS